MGRVAKYKKVKSFDPYSKKNRGSVDLPTVGVWGLGDNGRRKKKRSLKAEKLHARKHKLKSSKKNKNSSNNNNKFLDDGGFDIPPTDKDEFDMADLVGSIKKQKVENKDLLGSSSIINDAKTTKSESYDQIVTSSGNVANIPKTNEDETKVNKLLKLDQQRDKKSLEEQKQLHARKEGESKNAYSKRTRAETRQIIKQSATTPRNLEKLQRKKEFLKNRRKRKKGGNSYYSNEINNDDDDGDDNNARTRKHQVSDIPVRFGEQAERPPIFRQIPRGAKSKSNTKSTIATKSEKTKGMTDDQIEMERDAMELMRRRIQAQYKVIKTKRRDNGDFHL